MALRKYDKEWLEELCKNSYSLAEVLRKAGRKGGGPQQTLKKKIAEYNIDISHFTGQNWNKGKNKENDERIARQSKNQEKYTLEEVFKKDSTITQHGLRGYIQRYNLIEYKCAKCGCDGHWQNGEIKLEIHHRDGNNHNNEINNLVYLCPNCHALTDNFRGKNKTENQNTNIISEEKFVKALREQPNIRQALLSLNLAAKGGNYDRAKALMEKYNIQK
jgi:Zn finger protein HypA/HybF involved in hydrogenase expression